MKIQPQFAITNEHLDDGVKSVTVIGPSSATLSHDEIVKSGTKFRLFDGDGELAFEGVFVGDAGSEDAFLPLDCFGEPSAGCTRIDYHVGQNRYETL